MQHAEFGIRNSDVFGAVPFCMLHSGCSGLMTRMSRSSETGLWRAPVGDASSVSSAQAAGQCWSRGPRHQGAQADQVISSRRERDDPIDARPAAMAQLAQAADGFHPAEDLLDQFPFPLADGIPPVARGAAIDGRAFGFLRDMRR